MIECPVCKTECPSQDKINYPAGTRKIEAPERILLCPNCELGFAHPMLSEEALDELYKGSTYWGGPCPEITRSNFPVPFALAKARWGLIERFAKVTKEAVHVLDIGAGHGCLGLTAQQNLSAPLHYSAVEPDPNLQKALKDVWANGPRNGSLKSYDTLELVEEQFDIIVLSHVLEHVTNPIAFLESILQYLTPGGIFFIDVPNQDYLFKLDLFPHLLFFSPDSLKYLLNHLSLDILELDGWGRSRDSTPANGYTVSPLNIVEKFVHKGRRVIPGVWSQQYFEWHFGTDKRDQAGTWLRAIVQKKPS